MGKRSAPDEGHDSGARRSAGEPGRFPAIVLPALFGGQRHAVPPLAAQPAGLDPLATPGIAWGAAFASARPCIPMPPVWSRNWPASCKAPSIALLPTPSSATAWAGCWPSNWPMPCVGAASKGRWRYSSPAYPRPPKTMSAGYRRAKADAELVAALRDYRGTPEAVLNDPSLMQMLLPVVRADFLVTGSYRYQAHGPLDAALHLFGGREDSLRSAELLGWLHEAGGDFTLDLLDGQHFFIREQQGQLLRLLRRYAGQHLLRWHKDKVREACAPPVEGRPRRLFPDSLELDCKPNSGRKTHDGRLRTSHHPGPGPASPRCPGARAPGAALLAEDDGEGVVLSYRDLDLRARSIAAALQAHAQLGDRAVLLFPAAPTTSRRSSVACMPGSSRMPAYPPESARRHHQERLLSIIADAEPRLVLTTADLREPLLQMNAQLSAANAPQLLCVDQLDPAVAEAWDEPQVRPEHIAFLQYTSGSTALPKGVQVSHGNLVANEVLIRRGFGIGADDVIVSWLPLYHDHGPDRRPAATDLQRRTLRADVAALLLERPVRWLEAISQYGGTVSGGPDFAYRLCSERVAESALQRLDLSGWRVAFSGSEPIRQDSLNASPRNSPPAASTRPVSSPAAGLRRGDPVRHRRPARPGHSRPGGGWRGAGAQPHRRRRRQRADVLRPQPAGTRRADRRRGERRGPRRRQRRRDLGRRAEHRPRLLAQPGSFGEDLRRA